MKLLYFKDIILTITFIYVMINMNKILINKY